MTSSNYTISFVAGNLQVTVRPITVTAATQSKTYGDADPDLTYSVTTGSMVGTDVFTGELDRVAGESVGSYAIEQGDLSAGSNYDLTYVGANLSIGQRPITVTADPQTKVYGDGDPALTYSVTTGSMAGTDGFTGSLARDAGESVGTYAIRRNSLSAGSNYDLTYAGANLTIGQRPITVTADVQTKVYGAADPELTYVVTFGDLVNDDVFTGGLVRDAGESVADGPYAISQGDLSAGSNYDLTYVGADLSITPAPLTATVDPATKVYGELNPTFTLSFDGFVFGEDENDLGGAAVFSTDADETSGVGDYGVTPSGLTSSNYDISFVAGNLEVTKRPITVTAATQSKTYGNADPELTYAGADELVNGDVFVGELDRVPGESVGSYAIEQGDLSAGANYDLTYVGANLSIGQRGLTITANDRDKTYGESLTLGTSAFSTGAGELVNGDSVAAVSLASGGAAATAAKGDYDVTPSGAVAGTGTDLENYSISYEVGTLTVAARGLTITANDRDKTYGESLTLGTSAFSTGAGELVNGDSVAAVSLASGGAAATAAKGDYDVTPSGAVAGTGTDLENYSISYEVGTLTVAARGLTITANDRDKTYGESLTLGTSAFSTGAGELVNGDSVAAVSLASGGAAATAAKGDYDVTPSGAVAGTGTDLENYSISYEVGTLTVAARGLTITANDRDKTYGESLTLGTSAFSTGAGELVNGDSVAAVSLASGGAAATAAKGDYDVTPSGAVAGTGTDLENYSISYEVGTLTVAARGLTITANDRDKTYGESLTLGTSAFSTGAGELVNGDSVAAVSLASGGAAATAAKGDYDVTPSGAVAGTGTDPGELLDQL